MINKYDVVMVGLGYIGLPTAGLIAGKGMNVLGVDINMAVVDTINSGKIHIIEPDLDGLIHHVINKGKLKAATTPANGKAYLIAVPTPFKENYEPDISFVLSATTSIIDYLEEGSLVILESTSPVGTTDKLKALINEKRPDLIGKYYLAYCPERVLPGNVIYELEHNDRVIGGIDSASTEKAIRFYKQFVKGTLHATGARTAEMCKLIENSYRDVNIAFANELSMICDKADINVWELIELANKHPRVNILKPGCGVGGHCIAVDPWFIVKKYPEEARIIRTAREINDYKEEWVKEKINNVALKFEMEHKRKPVIACLGLSFKPDIDDLRESPALEITESLIKDEMNILAVEPNIKSNGHMVITNYEEALEKADISVYLVKHKVFDMNLDKNIILDFCGVLS